MDDSLERGVAGELEHGARAADVDPPRGVVVDAHEVDAGEVMDPGDLLRQRAVLAAREAEIHVADVADEHLGAVAGAQRVEQVIGLERELVAREHVEARLRLLGEQLRDHAAGGERGEPGDQRDVARGTTRRAARAGRLHRSADRSVLGVDIGDDAVDLGAQRVEIAGVLDHPVRDRGLLGERQLRRDPRAGLVGG